MATELMLKWREELRSGTRNQTTGYLANTSGFCCLGVVCDIIKLQYVLGEKTHYYYDQSNPHLILSSSLTDTILEQLGISRDDQTHLIDMNDKRGKTFPEIADWLETNFP